MKLRDKSEKLTTFFFSQIKKSFSSTALELIMCELREGERESQLFFSSAHINSPSLTLSLLCGAYGSLVSLELFHGAPLKLDMFASRRLQ